MSAFLKIGTAEVLRGRTYDLDADSPPSDLKTTVVVMPGVYDVLSNGFTTVIMLTGQINQRGMNRLGDGMFTAVEGDVPEVGLDVRFPSKRFGPDEWSEFLAGPTCRDGGPEQRLRVRLGVAA